MLDVLRRSCLALQVLSASASALTCRPAITMSCNPMRCTLQAESSENVLAEKEAELAEKNETRAQSHFLAREAVLAMCENRGKP